jgi:hypothetical protein
MLHVHLCGWDVQKLTGEGVEKMCTCFVCIVGGRLKCGSHTYPHTDVNIAHTHRLLISGFLSNHSMSPVSQTASTHTILTYRRAHTQATYL